MGRGDFQNYRLHHLDYLVVVAQESLIPIVDVLNYRASTFKLITQHVEIERGARVHKRIEANQVNLTTPHP